jgi:general secretion pathway protein G
MTSHSSRHRGAFTLLEIMLVVLIIGLLIGMAIKFTAGHMGTAQTVRVNGDIEQLRTDLLVYQMQNGFLPTTEQGLKALVTKPDTEPKPRNWTAQLEQPLRDPWDREYLYVQPGIHNPKSFDIYSAGPDRTPNTDDDIGNWEKATN